MDKIAANNHFVTLRKEIKKAKAMVAGKLIRKIKELKKELENLDDEAKSAKIQNKIDTTYSEIKLLKKLDSYPMAKQATLQPGKDHWNKLASHSIAPAEERLTGLVLCKNNIQKQVTKFREDHKDCDEWLHEYIEYREKKNTLVKHPKKKKNTAQTKSMRTDKKVGSKRKSNEITNSHESASKLIPEQKAAPPRADPGCGDKEILHPSWESKRREKEILRAALSGKTEPPKRITFE